MSEMFGKYEIGDEVNFRNEEDRNGLIIDARLAESNLYGDKHWLYRVNWKNEPLDWVTENRMNWYSEYFLVTNESQRRANALRRLGI